MATKVSKQERQRMLKYAEELSAMASKCPAPSFRTPIFAAVRKIQSTFGMTDDQKKAEIVAALNRGAATQAEIVRETLLTKSDVSELLQQLEMSGFVTKTAISNTNGPGRKTSLYRVINPENSD